ncbi:uncharacterized protein LOC106867231 [Octopus bimaculoides]|uniref:uncharacterized protein LOC106867231 n=1 Tax=Octopus bimaculoides TaxID=37653 RepID=UPI00071C7326|nr:uncharacterized protein LOC106867231 [Octopus bimaculoides]|eukprot:XP_014767529.1 PREDICTED: uncharacterized protein LOC106867231 [Octopus bimaculoides]
MIFSLRQVMEKVREKNQELFMMFVDLTKAFDTVNRQALEKVLKKLGIPDKMLNVIISFHEEIKATVMSSGYRDRFIQCIQDMNKRPTKGNYQILLTPHMILPFLPLLLHPREVSVTFEHTHQESRNLSSTMRHLSSGLSNPDSQPHGSKCSGTFELSGYKRRRNNKDNVDNYDDVDENEDDIDNTENGANDK